VAETVERLKGTDCAFRRATPALHQASVRPLSGARPPYVGHPSGCPSAMLTHWVSRATLIYNFVNYTIYPGDIILLKRKVIFINDRMSSSKSSTKNQSGIYMFNFIGWILHKKSSIRGIEQ
jgi:hypothetical protein